MSCVLGIGDMKLIVSLGFSVLPKLTDEVFDSSAASVIGIIVIGVVSMPELFLCGCCVVLVLEHPLMCESSLGVGAVHLSCRFDLYEAETVQLSLGSGLGAAAAQLLFIV